MSTNLACISTPYTLTEVGVGGNETEKKGKEERRGLVSRFCCQGLKMAMNMSLSNFPGVTPVQTA
jgi:hypothetical protein